MSSRSSCPLKRHDFDDARPAGGERAGLVEGDRAEVGRRFEERAALDEHALPGGRGDAGDDAHGRRDHERTGQAITSSTSAR